MITAVRQGDFDLEIVGGLVRYWRWIAAATLLATALMLILQARAAPVYVASAVVSPTNNSNSGQTSKIGRLASFAGIDLTSAKPASNYERFLFLLSSPELAAYQIREHNMLRVVFAGQWDPARHRWKDAAGWNASLRAVINPIFGLPLSPPPDEHALAGYYARALETQKVPDSGLTRLVFHDADPARAKMLLRMLIEDANELLRREAAGYARQQADYLRTRIATTPVQDYRTTLIDLLAEQEQTLLLSNGSMPFAAEQIEAVNASPIPTKRPLLFGALAGVVAFCLASLVAVIVHNRRLYSAWKPAVK